MTTMDYRITEARIELRGLTFFAYHGVLPEERRMGNTFLVDLALDADISRAASSEREGSSFIRWKPPISTWG